MTSILVIDDEKGLRDNLRDILELHNFKVTTAKNGAIGFSKALAISPDLILCDVMMPVLNGYGFLEQIKNTELSGIPIIFLSAKAESSDQRYGMNLGADDYITKPFTAKEIVEGIKTRLKKSEYIKNKIVSSNNKSTYALSKLLNGHEIRTPLNVISGMTSLLNDLVDKEQKSESDQITKYAQNAVYNLTNIINNIYLFEMLKSELDENIFIPNLSVDIGGNINNLSQEFDRQVSINIDKTLFTNNKWMYLINYIYIELVFNAIKFSGKSDTISATNKKEENYTIISVKNSGSTLVCDPKQLQPFNKFSDRMDISGMGLGLYNVYQIVRKLGGEIKINTINNTTEIQCYLPNFE